MREHSGCYLNCEIWATRNTCAKYTVAPGRVAVISFVKMYNNCIAAGGSSIVGVWNV